MKYIVTKADGSELNCPAVVFLAKDLLAIAALERYYDVLLQYHPDQLYRDAWFDILALWRHWRREHARGLKLPD